MSSWPGRAPETVPWGRRGEIAATRLRHLLLPAAPPGPPGADRAAAPLARRGLPRLSLLAPGPEPLPPGRLHRAGRPPGLPRDLRRSLHARQHGHRRADGDYGRGRDGGDSPAGLPAGLLHGALRAAEDQGGPGPGDPPAALVELPGAGLLLEAHSRQGGGGLLVRRAGAAHLAARRAPGPARHRRAVAVRVGDRDLPGVRVRLAAVYDPAGRGGARTRAALAPRGLERPRRPPGADLPAGDAAAGLPGPGGGTDLHLLPPGR